MDVKPSHNEIGAMGNLLPGQLSYVFMVAILDAALLSWLALWWYSRSVSSLMRDPAGVRPPSPAKAVAPEQTAATGPPSSLGFAMFGPKGGSPSKTESSPDRRAAVRRLFLAYSVGAALHSAVMTVLILRPLSPSVPAVAWFAEWWINAWPIVPTLMILLVLERGASLRLVASYILVGCVALSLFTLAGQLLRGTLNSAPLTNPYGLIVALVWTAVLPLVLILITGWRRIRAVAPLALATTLVFAFGSMFFREALMRAFDPPALRSVLLAISARSSAEAAYYGLFMLVALPIGYLAWRLLRKLAADFEHKRFSDVQLVIDCWWLIVTAEQIARALSPVYGIWGIGGGLAAFVAYRLGVAAVLVSWPVDQHVPPRRLLLLRVFGYQSRTESLFDRVAQLWRFHGPVQLIAGVDLAARTADPGDMLAFVGGGLADQYVATPDEIPKRVEHLDLKRDPDGRFRVNELYCRHDTWRPALEALLDASDTVLMDLRSFSRQNAGCIFELEQLVLRVPSEQIVLVCDGTTDLELLAQTMSAAWSRAQSEGRARGAGRIALVRINRHSQRELRILVQRLLGVGEPQQVLSAADLPRSLA